MGYRFREGFRKSVRAEVAGAELEAIAAEHEGLVEPKAVVNRARPSRAPLHGCFEWDDTRAGEMFRETQARELIRSLVVVQEDAGGGAEEVRLAFVHVELADESKGYVTTAQMLSDEDLRSQVLHDALELLNGVKKRFEQLSELREVFAAVARATKRASAKWPKQGKKRAA